MSLGVGGFEESFGCCHILRRHLAFLFVPKVAVGLAFSKRLIPDAQRFGPLVLRVLD
jgi:hypothetical protein